jgi:hypothetical protein
MTKKPKVKKIRVGICFKDFACWTGMSHIGLNVAALTNARVLSQNGIQTAVFPVRNNIDLVNSINQYNDENVDRLTHVIVSAPWLSKMDMVSLIKMYPEINFVIESHSNVGFLQADPLGLRLLRDTLDLSRRYKNIHVAGNTSRFVDWMSTVYGGPVVCLPNLYPLTEINHRDWDGHSTIKIGVFGAVRPLKNFMTAGAAAMAIHSLLNVPVEIHMSIGGEGDGGDVTRSIEQMTLGVPGVTLVRHPWQPWAEFIQLISKMDLMIQPSFTESFNMVTADGILVGVPSVVSTAITWVPDNWKADSDNALDIARVGIDLLRNPQAEHEGIAAIQKQNDYGLTYWKQYLNGESQAGIVAPPVVHFPPGKRHDYQIDISRVSDPDLHGRYHSKGGNFFKIDNPA